MLALLVCTIYREETGILHIIQELLLGHGSDDLVLGEIVLLNESYAPWNKSREDY